MKSKHMKSKQHKKMRTMKRSEWPKAWLADRKRDLRKANMKRRQLSLNFGEGY